MEDLDLGQMLVALAKQGYKTEIYRGVYDSVIIRVESRKNDLAFFDKHMIGDGESKIYIEKSKSLPMKEIIKILKQNVDEEMGKTINSL